LGNWEIEPVNLPISQSRPKRFVCNACVYINTKKETKMNIALWVLQGLLAVMFLLAGFMKASQSKEAIP